MIAAEADRDLARMEEAEEKEMRDKNKDGSSLEPLEKVNYNVSRASAAPAASRAVGSMGQRSGAADGLRYLEVRMCHATSPSPSPSSSPSHHTTSRHITPNLAHITSRIDDALPYKDWFASASPRATVK